MYYWSPTLKEWSYVLWIDQTRENYLEMVVIRKQLFTLLERYYKVITNEASS